MSEIDLRFAPGPMNFFEEGFTIRPVNGSPVSDPTLQGRELALTKSFRVFWFEQLQDRRRLQNTILVASQQRNDPCIPNPHERIVASSPASLLLRLRGQRTSLPVPGSSNTHPCNRRRGLLTLSIHAFLPQQRTCSSVTIAATSSPVGQAATTTQANRQF